MKNTKRSQGFALVLSLLIVAIVGSLVLGSLMLSVVDRRISSNDAATAQAMYAAQAGAAFWKSELVSFYEHLRDPDNFQLYIDAINESDVLCGNYLAIGYSSERNGEIDVNVGDWFRPITIPIGSSSSGSARVRFDVDGSAVVLESVGEVNGSRSTVIEEFTISSIGIWNNAVFAQSGAANARIQGRAEIRGGIHLLGEGLSSSSMALDVTGNFGLGNTYRNISPSLGVSGLRLSQPDPADLCATLRVRNGYIQMDGSANIGYPANTSPTDFIHNMRGIYTNHGIRGGTEGTNVFSENGMTARYDAGDYIQFPNLDDWRDNLIKNSLVLSADPNKDDRTLLEKISSPNDASEPGYYLSSGCNNSVFGAPGSSEFKVDQKQNASANFSCRKYHVKSVSPLDYDMVVDVSWTRISNHVSELSIKGTGGVITFLGADLKLTGGNGSNDRIEYKGNGILFAEHAGGTGGNIKMEVDLLPASGETYPNTALTHLVARNRIISQGAQKRFTVAMYAEKAVKITQQTLVAGGIVTKEFDAGSQVPTVLYVPNLAERLSRLMPGTDNMPYAVSNVAWRRR